MKNKIKDVSDRLKKIGWVMNASIAYCFFIVLFSVHEQSYILAGVACVAIFACHKTLIWRTKLEATIKTLSTLDEVLTTFGIDQAKQAK